jgi:uncharacterized protein (TIGR03435 family)
VCLISGFGVAAQTRIPAPSHYEVASIKPNQSGARHAILSYPGGRLVTTYATLKALIGFAYNLRDYQISGGPNWLDSTGYDILASPEHPVNPSAETIDTFHQLMRTLLSDRFQLTTHFEARELRVYALVPAERKGRCPATPINGGTFRKGGADATRFARVPQYDGAKLEDAGNVQDPGDMRLHGGIGLMTAQHIPMEFVAQQLSDRLGRLVIDKTGLTRHYNFKLEWTPDETDSNGVPPYADRTGPSLFTALQEQLGLKLESQKAPVQILVIDRAERASEN